MTLLAEKKEAKPDLKDIDLPYILPRRLLMTTGRWNGVDFPPSSISDEAKRLAADSKAEVRLFIGAAMDHQDSTGTLAGVCKNFEWDGETLWGDCVILVEDAARIAKYQVETGAKLEGISPRMDTRPKWRPPSGRVEKIVRFRSFGIVLDPAQGSQAMLSTEKDDEGREVLEDGLFVLMQPEPGKGRGAGLPPQGKAGRDFCWCAKCEKLIPHERGTPCVDMKCPECGAGLVPATKEMTEGVNSVKLFCEKCELLFDEGTEKCSQCDGELKEADEETVERLEKLAKKRKDDEEKEKEKQEEEEEDEAKKAAEAQAKPKKKYPAPSYKKKPYYRGYKAPYGYRRPYYAKKDAEYYGPPSLSVPYRYFRKAALDAVSDVEELKGDLVSMCSDIVRFGKKGVLDVGLAIEDLTALLGEVPQSADLSKEEFDCDEILLAALKKNEEAEAKLVEQEAEAIEKAGKLPPAVREKTLALLSIGSDAVLSNDGENIDVASMFREIVAALPDGACMTFDEKTKRLVVAEATLGKEEDLREKGREMVKQAGMAKKG